MQNAAHADLVAEVIRALGTTLANVNKNTLFAGSEQREEPRTDVNSHSQSESEAAKLLGELVEPFREGGEAPLAAARRMFREDYPNFHPAVWRRQVARLGEEACLLASLLVGRFRRYWVQARDGIRNAVAYLSAMLRDAVATTILAQVRGVLANRRKAAPEAVQEAPAAETEPEVPPEPEATREPAQADPEAVEDAPPLRGAGAPEPEPTAAVVSTTPLSPEAVEQELWEAQQADRRGELPQRIAEAPLEVQTQWLAQEAKFPDVNSRWMMRAFLYRGELQRLGLLPHRR